LRDRPGLEDIIFLRAIYADAKLEVSAAHRERETHKHNMLLF